MFTFSRMVVQCNVPNLHKNDPLSILIWYEPPNWKDLVLKDTNVPEVRNQLENSQKTIDLLKVNLAMEQNHIRQQADQRRTERKLEVGDWVFVRLQPYK